MPRGRSNNSNTSNYSSNKNSIELQDSLMRLGCIQNVTTSPQIKNNEFDTLATMFSCTSEDITKKQEVYRSNNSRKLISNNRKAKNKDSSMTSIRCALHEIPAKSKRINSRRNDYKTIINKKSNKKKFEARHSVLCSVNSYQNYQRNNHKEKNENIKTKKEKYNLKKFRK